MAKNPHYIGGATPKSTWPQENNAEARARSLAHSGRATRGLRSAHHRHATTPQTPMASNVKPVR